jgi:hypothetical protein
MLADFSFEGSVGIRYAGKHFDLHSFFSIARLSVNPKEGTVLLEFESIKEFMDRAHGVRTLGLEFSGITYIELSPKICTNVSDSLEEFGFKSPSDRDDNWLKDVEQSDSDDHLFIRLSSLEFIRIQCATARVILAS